MASSGVRRLQQARKSKRRRITPTEQKKISRKISFLRKREGLPQRQAVGKAIGIIKR